MERHEVIQTLLNTFQHPRYLEIGVSTGATFSRIQADKKVAVDPVFAFEVPAARVTDRVEYQEITSDEYFQNCRLGRGAFDVVFLDGLHTFEQTLRDLLNALFLISEEGVVVVDDVLPNSYHAAMPDHRQAVTLRYALDPTNPDKSWMGDVYRLVFFVRHFLQALDYATIADNHGQLVLWRKRDGSRRVETTSLADIQQLEFADTVLHRDRFKVRAFSEILETARGVPASPQPSPQGMKEPKS